MGEGWRAVLRDVLAEAPGSIRELAEQAGLSHAALIRARDGEIDLTAESLERIERALRRYAERSAKLADRLSEARTRKGRR
jgi:hypothetical protein